MMVYTKDMIQKIIASLFFVVSLAFIFPAYASAAPITTTQEEEQNVTVQSDDEQKNTQSSLTNGQKLVNFMSTYFQPFVTNTNLFFTDGVVFMLSTGNASVSAPSPVLFSPGVGYSFRIFKFLVFEPRTSVFAQHYLWEESASYAYPAEIENRTATCVSLLIDLPLVITMGTKSDTIGLGAGVGLLPRYSFLSNGVSADDAGTSGSASDDVSKINGWLWSDARWLYPEMSVAYVHLLSNGWRVGLETRFYLPLGSLISGHGMDGMMVSTALRLVLPE